MAFALVGGAEQDDDRRLRIERGVLAALMHHKPNYRKKWGLVKATEVISDFVEGELDRTGAIDIPKA